MAEMDASLSGRPACLLFELDRSGLPEALRLLGELAEKWRSRGKSLLVVDAHPADPFLSGGGEGFSEMLHYGRSPASLAEPYPELRARRILAGGMGDLPAVDPAEPARSLRRLAASADRVVLLADSRDAEGLLASFIESAAFRLRLGDPDLDEHLARLSSRRREGRLRLILFLGLPLMVALIYLLLPDHEQGGEIDLEPVRPRPARPLPEKADLPYFGGAEAVLRDSSRALAAPAETLAADAGEAPKAAPWAPRRRGESRSAWNSALDHQGSFHLHVSSFRDSDRALLAQEEEGYAGLPVRIQPVLVKGRTWYRVLVGRFPDLRSAAAFRDSLLDQAGKNYCVIGIDPEP